MRRLLDFAKPAPLGIEPVWICRLLDETLEFLSSECLRQGVEVERSYVSQEILLADPQQLRQVFLNLFLNSLEAMERSGLLSVSTNQHGDTLTVMIKDTGSGISKDHLDRIFEPFFTTKSQGTGLGLSVVKNILAEHSATIHLESDGKTGTCCTVKFPIKTTVSEPQSSTHSKVVLQQR